ncbi:MAG: aldehyde dehydrogenase family protein, partial [Actinobacteria bacterium]|nr:aldehyde dehydrogenase family protein [Actinomycetota bacterium]
MTDYSMLIGGRWVESESGERTTAESPATGDPIGTVPEGTRKDARNAIAAGNDASPGWAALSA